MLMRYLREEYEAYRAHARYRDTDSDWAVLREAIGRRELASGPPRRLIIVPSDPWTLTGAKGDEAMIQAVVSQLKAQSPLLTVGIVTASDLASSAARQLGFVPLQVWRQPLRHVVDAMIGFDADCLAVLGADCMDGYYGADTTLNLLALADLAARLGIRTTILGFSFNDQPVPRLAEAFDALDERVGVHVRDDVSLERFKKFSSARANLVADSAFMLTAVTDTDPVRQAEAWARGQRAAGRQVLGFNVHPMLIRNPSPEQLVRLVDNVARSVTDFMDTHAVALAMISHDYRGSSGDDACLKPLVERLLPRFGSRVFYKETRCSAAELKGIAGAMDGVVTGRMHLAIASLGMGTPVAALTYQDKFQGLMRHFDLPQELLLPPEKLCGPEPLTALLSRFAHDVPAYQAQVAQRLGAVKALSSLNVRELLV